MQVATAVFRMNCYIGTAFLVILCTAFPSFPLASSAANAGSHPAVISMAVERQLLPEEKPYQLLPTVNDDATLSPDKPVYDPWTVDERRNEGWPTALPPLTPYYRAKTVYLTFDDGPDPENTPRILAILAEHHIHATFFLVGTQAQTNPDLVRRLFDSGQAIGNHSYNHRYRQLYQSADTYVAQLKRTDTIIKDIIGMRPRITRAPGGTVGSFNAQYWRKLRRDGYVDISWNISSGDAAGLNAIQMVASVEHQLQNQALGDHAIILMHDGTGHSETVRALPEIITYLQHQGFTFQVVTPLTPPAW